MALFNKEPEKNIKPQQPAAVPQPPVSPSTPAPQAAAATADSKVAPKPAPAGDARAYLDSGSRINGKVHFESPARIDGQVEGEITAKESLTVGESAVITAQIKAAAVVIAGKVSGDINASRRIEIRPSAKVIGNLTTPVLVIQEGALFEGHCTMQAEGAHEERKVTVFPKEERLTQAAAKQA
jgi:cytoskeletal protein CcmA (bactofilin family)